MLGKASSLAVAILEPGERMRARVMAKTQERSLQGREAISESRPMQWVMPSRAATWPCGPRDQTTSKALIGAPQEVAMVGFTICLSLICQ